MQQRVMRPLTSATSLSGWASLDHVSRLQTVEAEAIALHDSGHLTVRQRLECLTRIQRMLASLAHYTEITHGGHVGGHRTR